MIIIRIEGAQEFIGLQVFFPTTSKLTQRCLFLDLTGSDNIFSLTEGAQLLRERETTHMSNTIKVRSESYAIVDQCKYTDTSALPDRKQQSFASENVLKKRVDTV